MSTLPVLDQLVHSTLTQHPHLARQKLRFEMNEGRVVLKGVVSSYYQKQMAQESLRRVAGVSHIENHLEVSWA